MPDCGREVPPHGPSDRLSNHLATFGAGTITRCPEPVATEVWADSSCGLHHPVKLGRSAPLRLTELNALLQQPRLSPAPTADPGAPCTPLSCACLRSSLNASAFRLPTAPRKFIAWMPCSRPSVRIIQTQEDREIPYRSPSNDLHFRDLHSQSVESLQYSSLETGGKLTSIVNPPVALHRVAI